MNPIAPVEHAGAVLPVVRRDPAHIATSREHPGQGGRENGRSAHDESHDAPPVPEKPAAPVNPTCGGIVNTFAT